MIPATLDGLPHSCRERQRQLLELPLLGPAIRARLLAARFHGLKQLAESDHRAGHLLRFDDCKLAPIELPEPSIRPVPRFLPTRAFVGNTLRQSRQLRCHPRRFEIELTALLQRIVPIERLTAPHASASQGAGSPPARPDRQARRALRGYPATAGRPPHRPGERRAATPGR